MCSTRPSGTLAQQELLELEGIKRSWKKLEDIAISRHTAKTFVLYLPLTPYNSLASKACES